MNDDEKELTSGVALLAGFAFAALVYSALPPRVRRQVLELVAGALPKDRTQSKPGKVIAFPVRPPAPRFRQ